MDVAIDSLNVFIDCTVLVNEFAGDERPSEEDRILLRKIYKETLKKFSMERTGKDSMKSFYTSLRMDAEPSPAFLTDIKRLDSQKKAGDTRKKGGRGILAKLQKRNVALPEAVSVISYTYFQYSSSNIQTREHVYLRNYPYIMADTSNDLGRDKRLMERLFPQGTSHTSWNIGRVTHDMMIYMLEEMKARLSKNNRPLSVIEPILRKMFPVKMANLSLPEFLTSLRQHHDYWKNVIHSTRFTEGHFRNESPTLNSPSMCLDCRKRGCSECSKKCCELAHERMISDEYLEGYRNTSEDPMSTLREKLKMNFSDGQSSSEVLEPVKDLKFMMLKRIPCGKECYMFHLSPQHNLIQEPPKDSQYFIPLGFENFLSFSPTSSPCNIFWNSEDGEFIEGMLRTHLRRSDMCFCEIRLAINALLKDLSSMKEFTCYELFEHAQKTEMSLERFITFAESVFDSDSDEKEDDCESEDESLNDEDESESVQESGSEAECEICDGVERVDEEDIVQMASNGRDPIIRTFHREWQRNFGDQLINQTTATFFCHHEGPCGIENESCVCSQRRMPCLRDCLCSDDCRLRFPGCDCMPGNCRTNKCDCHKAMFECSPDTCTRCTAGMFDEPTSMETNFPHCLNMGLQCNDNKQLLVQKSSLPNAGFGVFALEPIPTDHFIMEYTGEIITLKETARRESWYRMHNYSIFIFNLTDNLSIDSRFIGNETRFINHSQDPNVWALPKFHCGAYRITFVAARDIASGEELFIDYGTSFPTSNFDRLEDFTEGNSSTCISHEKSSLIPCRGRKKIRISDWRHSFSSKRTTYSLTKKTEKQKETDED